MVFIRLYCFRVVYRYSYRIFSHVTSKKIKKIMVNRIYRILFCICLPFCALANETPKYFWVESGAGFVGYYASANFANDAFGWGGSVSKHYQQLLGSATNKETMESFNPSLISLAVLRNWTHRYSLGYLNIGAGVSYVKGRWGTYCQDNTTDETIVGRDQYCKEKVLSTLGIPNQISVVFGRY